MPCGASQNISAKRWPIPESFLFGRHHQPSIRAYNRSVQGLSTCFPRYGMQKPRQKYLFVDANMAKQPSLLEQKKTRVTRA